MKKSIIYIWVAICGMTTVSCDFLVEPPRVAFTDEVVYSTESGLEASVSGLYQGLHFYAASNYFYYLGNASKFSAFSGNRQQTEFLQSHDLTMYSENIYNLNMYSSLYSSIKNCNNLLDKLPESPVNDEYKIAIAAEAKLFRALYYFNLVRLYGDVPLILNTSTDENAVHLPRSPYYEVYARIVKDLEEAETYMRDVDQQEAINPMEGRFNRMAATALKSSVYVWIASLLESVDCNFFDVNKPGRTPEFSALQIRDAEDAWKLALEAAQTVISSEVYALEPDFRNLFRWDQDNHPEDYMSKERIIMTTATGTHGASPAKFTLWSNAYGTDASQSSSSNEGRIRASRWMWQRWAETHGGELVLDDATDISYYHGCPDPRFDATFAHSVIYTYKDGVLSSSEVYPATGLDGNAGTCPYFKKYFSTRYMADSGYADMYVLRYAEVILNAAEAAASLGNESLACDYLNMILARARNSVDGQPASYPVDVYVDDFSSQEELVDAIMWERLFEFNGEFHEWFDTHRRGAKWLKDNVCAPLYAFLQQEEQASFKKQSFNNQVETLNKDAEALRASILCAFPADEIRRNSKIELSDQNDFYIE